MIPEQTVDTADVARFLLPSPHRVRQLAAEGVLERVVDEMTGEPLRGRFNLLSAGCRFELCRVQIKSRAN